MLGYILRRLLLIIPTLFGILLINFAITQAAPGGPVEQAIAKVQGLDTTGNRVGGSKQGDISNQSQGNESTYRALHHSECKKLPYICRQSYQEL